MNLRNLIVALLAAVAGLGCQVSTDLLPPPAAARRPEPASEEESVPEVRPRSAPACDQPWTFDFVGGLPTGVRLQRTLTPANGPALLAEGFAGLGLIFPMAGGGLRCRLPVWSGECDSLTVAPGADGYVVAVFMDGGPGGLGLVTGDVDLSWQHRISEGWTGELGIKLGAGELFLGHKSLVVPVVAVFGGWGF